ncbi:unnamed protein product, partial [Staurois parvus]
QTVGNFCALYTSACADPAVAFYVAYHFVGELLLLPVASNLLEYQQLTVAYLVARKLHRWQPIMVPRLNSLS